MKKLLYLLLFIPLGLFGQTATISLNVGAAPNDGTGTTLRNFAIMTKTDFAAVRDSLSNIYREVQVLQKINDSLMQLRADALPLGDYVYLKTDPEAVSQTDLDNLTGGGVASKFYTLSGRVDDSGFPNAGDSTLLHTNFVGKHLTVIREGQLQQQHIDNTTQDGYKFDNATGTITFRPVLAASEQLEIWSTNTIQWEALVAEGGGGEAESSLLTGLRAWWQFDEASGTVVNDVLDTYNGTTNATVNQAGKFGVAESFTAASSQVANMGYDVGDVGTSDWSFGAWFYVTASGATFGIMGDWGDYPYYYIMVNSTNKVRCVLNFANSNLTFDSNAEVTTSTWFHVVINCDRSGNAVMYLNGVAQADVEDISAHAAVSMTKAGSTNRFAVGAIGDAIAGYYFTGRIDCPFIYTRILTQDEINDLVIKTYPFN